VTLPSPTKGTKPAFSVVESWSNFFRSGSTLIPADDNQPRKRPLLDPPGATDGFEAARFEA
jgi:hypothetical protein